ncbi:hypothetical protein SARC_08848 [Sphaeroforma arctica JP610]|uniref:Uncharacterized protein n=1 Tax=Sphaeroforma arctica JP610 TaxID=667725 RepID=A0A0L0FPI3_9EUKA|nr:hypothetical protein SARC_08848 [Sphaeroforma arctica JP610]KNC78725.1 hypothetical protein SARC_08848 [Sphaeroforma arctica JP610]|eukprot:XP_014152627.1 hypothetical protein SARC_08848 [Sphaeroforma arctica JP610]
MVPSYDPKTAIATKAEYDEYVKTIEQHMSIPLRKVAVLTSVWIVLFVCSISKKFLGCNWSFVALSVVPFFYALAITMWRSSIAVHEYNLKIKCQHVFHPTDFIWTPSTVVTYPGVAFMAGVTAGAVGIGGAMVLGPILLLMSKETDPVGVMWIGLRCCVGRAMVLGPILLLMSKENDPVEVSQFV